MGLRTILSMKLIKRTFKNRFFLAKLTNLPVIGHAIEFAFFEDDDIIILPKDSVIDKNRKKREVIRINVTFEPESIVLPSQIIEYFIRKSRYHFIMNRCVCREANQCKEYPQDLGCIFLGRGALKIDRNLGRLVTMEEALAHLEECRKAGLVHLIGRNKIDSVVFSNTPKEELLSICSCCPCCCLWKMIPQLSRRISDTVTKMPGLRIEIDKNLCRGCGACIKKNVCFVDAIHIENDSARIRQDLCKGCARCVEFCPNGAIKLIIEDSSFVEASIRRIAPLVDIESE
ncbi:MAG: 4Fe-4S binding protein [Methanomassiliicoccales archaeon]|jgi:ferredoxin|nr:4Fe-4S binding protein [Methanomassiliicoccales archaeon]